MGGHGGLNILPQKRWNVYNFDNREKVRKDEEAAAKEEQLHREKVRKLEAGIRLDKLREARGFVPSDPSKPPEAAASSEPEKNSNHINLFQGLKDFGDIVEGKEDGAARIEREKFCKKMRVKKEEPKVVTPEDEKYRLGYGIAGKGVKLPWYLAKPNADEGAESGGRNDVGFSRLGKEGVKAGGKKPLQELREERLKRERQEKERAHNLLREKNRSDGGFSKVRDFSRR